VKLTASQLRQIIKEELEKEMGLVDEGLMDKLKGPLIAAGIGASLGVAFTELPQDHKETIVINGLALYRPTALYLELDQIEDQINDPETPEEEKEELVIRKDKITDALKIAEFNKASPYRQKGNK